MDPYMENYNKSCKICTANIHDMPKSFNPQLSSTSPNRGEIVRTRYGSNTHLVQIHQNEETNNKYKIMDLQYLALELCQAI